LGIDPEQREFAYVEMQEYFNPDDWGDLDRLLERAIQHGLPYEIDL
jgi:hypothetical protein